MTTCPKCNHNIKGCADGVHDWRATGEIFTSIIWDELVGEVECIICGSMELMRGSELHTYYTPTQIMQAEKKYKLGNKNV